LPENWVDKVLVPGASAPAGINTIKSLRMAKFKGKIVSTDSSSLSAGFFMSDINEVIPEADSGSFFVDRLFEIVTTHRIQILMPSSGFDIYPYSENRKELSEIGAEAVVSDRDVLEICRDKILTFQTLSGSFDVPYTTSDPAKIREFPVIAKPRFGKGSRDVIRIDDESDLSYVTSKFGEMIFQEFLPGKEYTIDVLSDLDKKSLMAVPRLRIQTKAGISTKGKIIRNPKMELNCMKIAQRIGIRGPCCIQMKESPEGVLKLIEINPRMGGGTIFSALAGANFPAMIVDMVQGKEISIPELSPITVVRYFEEIVIKNEEQKVSAEEDLLSKTHVLG
jgi:carbamoyl-phosphate synthase large subunit